MQMQMQIPFSECIVDEGFLLRIHALSRSSRPCISLTRSPRLWSDRIVATWLQDLLYINPVSDSCLTKAVMEISSNSSSSTALHDTSTNTADGVDPRQMDTVSRMHEQSANKIIVAYLLERVGELRKFCQLRQEVSKLYQELEYLVSYNVTPNFRAGKIPKATCFSLDSVLLQMLATCEVSCKTIIFLHGWIEHTNRAPRSDHSNQELEAHIGSRNFRWRPGLRRDCTKR
jgi:hypothetical protein